MKLAAVVVTYYPDENVLSNISTYIDSVDLLIIWENTPLKDREAYRIEVPDKNKKKIFFMGENSNKGLGYAYNRAIEYVRDKGYSHLMTMDQDSHFISFSGFIDKIVQETDKKVGLKVPLRNQEKVHDWDPPYELKWGIQSGCIFNIEMFDEIGGFNEDLFVDHTDVEIGLRARKYGYKCMCYSGCNMIHTMGSCRTESVGKFKFSDRKSVV